MSPPVEPLRLLAPSPAGLDRMRSRLRSRRRRRTALAVAAAVLLLATWVEPRPSSPPPQQVATPSAATDLLAHADHPALVAWGRAEDPPRPAATDHPDVMRVIQAGATR